MAWQFNCQPVLVEGVAESPDASFIETSENVIIEAVRREGADIELRLVECLGLAGTARVAVALPHGRVALTDLRGARPLPLAGASPYRFPIRPQQIVTLRLATAGSLPEIQPLLKWDPLVPAHKLVALRKPLKGRKGPPG